METTAARRAPSRLVPPRHVLRLAGDERLVDYVRDASQPAFEVLYDRHHRAILGFCRHMLSDATEAEDAVQHTFMSAYRNLVGSDKPIQLKPWLYTIARNRCLTILRGRRETASDDVDAPSFENLAETVQRRQDLQDLLRDVADLPEDQRAALVLSEIGDISHDEIADVLGCQREKVKALVFQARSSLADSRKARDTDCTEIREQLATLRGGSLRRNSLRRHVRECPGCAAYAVEMRSQRQALAIALPVIPTLGLKENALAAAFGAGGSGAALTAGGAAAGGAAVAGGAATAGTGAGALAAKALVVVALAGGGGAAGVTALTGERASKPATPAGGSPTNPSPSPAAALGGQATANEAREGEDGPVRRRVRKRPNGSNAGGKRLAKGKANRPATVAERKEDKQEAVQKRRAARKQRTAAKKQAKVRKRTAARRRAVQPKPEKVASVRPQRTPAPRRTPEPRATPEPTPAPVLTPEPTSEPEPEQGLKAEGSTRKG